MTFDLSVVSTLLYQLSYKNTTMGIVSGGADLGICMNYILYFN